VIPARQGVGIKFAKTGQGLKRGHASRKNCGPSTPGANQKKGRATWPGLFLLI
jgi:hypothetical protein